MRRALEVTSQHGKLTHISGGFYFHACTIVVNRHGGMNASFYFQVNQRDRLANLLPDKDLDELLVCVQSDGDAIAGNERDSRVKTAVFGSFGVSAEGPVGPEAPATVFVHLLIKFAIVDRNHAYKAWLGVWRSDVLDDERPLKDAKARHNLLAAGGNPCRGHRMAAGRLGRKLEDVRRRFGKHQ